ncbi:aroma-sacti cluster domain-containing protein [Streptomyces sp. NPDC002742]|jgi:hypothetical protein|uniref:aroma-sacti cluster domain-containing protein n=1 Tax=Streptomyces TaxID=1883 RepID=UPI0021BFC883|nr:aroma-sacti cluster domain-containing protein [Streptomyces rhizosphaerihabitans]MCT9006120.1 hypothetical protein [Streptomyces rhizosphaerihabitans]
MSDPHGTAVLDQLRAAGFPVDQMPEPQLATMAALTQDEADLLISLKSRLDEATPDVVAHSEWAGGVVW